MAPRIGIGERVGNTPMDMLLVNLVLLGRRHADLMRLGDYCRTVSEACGVPIPANYPVFGRDAYRTATGVHAAAVIKAFKKKDAELADAVYSGVPASLVGREQIIEVGPMSGRSNVVYWLESRGLDATDERVDRIFAASQSRRRCPDRGRNPAAALAAAKSVHAVRGYAVRRYQVGAPRRSFYSAAFRPRR